MTFTKRKTAFAGLAAIGASALILSGCAAAPTDGGTDAPTTDFIPCMVSDSGGFDDHSFNELGLAGLTAAAKEIGATPNSVESSSEDDFAPNIEAQIGEGCNLIVTVGFLLSAATNEAAAANPTIDFAIVDDGLDANGDGKPDVTNGKPILFDTAQAAFLAGYAAASYSKTGVVGTFGGIPIPPV
ncbi:MAG: BMP family ABC transporter substrate-binding protein, partial [Pseudolysinimonas sp.]